MTKTIEDRRRNIMSLMDATKREMEQMYRMINLDSKDRHEQFKIACNLEVIVEEFVYLERAKNHIQDISSTAQKRYVELRGK